MLLDWNAWTVGDFLILAVLLKINVTPKYLVPPASLAQNYRSLF